ncbi:MAG: hypothetical protein ACFWTZ_09335 [Burkholderia sp.]|jgi:type 1 fimbria pilin
MNRERFFSTAAAALMPILGASAAFAAPSADSMKSGVFDFTVTVKASACAVSVDSKTQSVNLGRYPVSYFRKYSGTVPKSFTISMNGCSQASLARLSLSDGLRSGTSESKYLTAAGTAEGIAVAVRAAGSTEPFDFSQGPVRMYVNNTRQNLSFEAFLWAPQGYAAVKPGTIQARMDYVIEYK